MAFADCSYRAGNVTTTPWWTLIASAMTFPCNPSDRECSAPIAARLDVMLARTGPTLALAAGRLIRGVWGRRGALDIFTHDFVTIRAAQGPSPKVGLPLARWARGSSELKSEPRWDESTDRGSRHVVIGNVLNSAVSLVFRAMNFSAYDSEQTLLSGIKHARSRIACTRNIRNDRRKLSS